MVLWAQLFTTAILISLNIVAQWASSSTVGKGTEMFGYDWVNIVYQTMDFADVQQMTSKAKTVNVSIGLFNEPSPSQPNETSAYNAR